MYSQKSKISPEMLDALLTVYSHTSFSTVKYMDSETRFFLRVEQLFPDMSNTNRYYVSDMDTTKRYCIELYTLFSKLPVLYIKNMYLGTGYITIHDYHNIKIPILSSSSVTRSYLLNFADKDFLYNLDFNINDVLKSINKNKRFYDYSITRGSGTTNTSTYVGKRNISYLHHKMLTDTIVNDKNINSNNPESYVLYADNIHIPAE